MCDYAILAGNEKSSGRHKVKHKTMGRLSLLCCDVTSFSCMSQTLNQSRQIPLLIHYKTLNQLHVQLIHTLIHKSTRNNICFFLPEIHSFTHLAIPNHPIIQFFILYMNTIMFSNWCSACASNCALMFESSLLAMLFELFKT